MTAPDPDFSARIAAHTLRVVVLNEAARYPECNGCDWVGGLVRDHAEHLKSVVEQHTGPIFAELYEQRDNAIEAGLAAIDRAEKAEAKATELEVELEKYRAEEREDLEWQRFCAQQDVRCTVCNLRYGEREQYGCGDPPRAHHYDEDELRAALEGNSFE
ncbi:hypothetical protein ACFVWF_32850 [Rhodococcus qingshengii]|uniref:hypothetical protein n=1 Tax=Rhodococcus qingshengii TaxID=334542 RepID=UPI0036DAF073